MAQITPQEGSSAQGMTPPPTYGFGVTIDAPFDEAVTRVTEALKEEGFGILTTIDVRQTLRDKLQVDFERYLILGACNPHLAHRALEAEHHIGLLLPCNVIVYEAHEVAPAKTPARTRIEIADPIAMLSAANQPALREIADEAQERLQRVVARLNP